MPQIPDLLSMLKAGAHFGHKLSKRHPKMEPYIFTAKNGFHIINIEQTQTMLAGALEFVSRVVSNGGVILFIGTKKQAQPIVKRYAQECGMPYVTERWLGGTFTNFMAISKLSRKYTTIKEQRAQGGLDKYTKKEQLEFDREIEKLEKVVGGIEGMNRIPEAMFVVDVKREKTAVQEAIRKNVPIVAICDTNANPDLVTYPIPANDDAVKSIEMMTQLVAAAVMEGRERRERQAAMAAAVPAAIPASIEK